MHLSCLYSALALHLSHCTFMAVGTEQTHVWWCLWWRHMKLWIFPATERSILCPCLFLVHAAFDECLRVRLALHCTKCEFNLCRLQADKHYFQRCRRIAGCRHQQPNTSLSLIVYISSQVRRRIFLWIFPKHIGNFPYITQQHTQQLFVWNIQE